MKRGWILIILGISIFFGVNSAFADPHTIETANDSGLNLECGTQCYTPNTLTVDVGHIVTMTNTDETGIHTFTSGNVYGFAAIPDGEFDSGMLNFGESFEFISNIPDVYPYYCSLHVWMQGVFIVQEAEAEEVIVNPPQAGIPDWVRNVASFWCEDKIDDAAFIEGIQYLIDNNIIIVSTTSGYGSSQEIPNWVKNTACWWSEGLITSEDFTTGIEFLVSEGIIRV